MVFYYDICFFFLWMIKPSYVYVHVHIYLHVCINISGTTVGRTIYWEWRWSSMDLPSLLCLVMQKECHHLLGLITFLRYFTQNSMKLQMRRLRIMKFLDRKLKQNTDKLEMMQYKSAYAYSRFQITTWSLAIATKISLWATKKSIFDSPLGDHKIHVLVWIEGYHRNQTDKIFHERHHDQFS